ncbi:XRE family transcriptional regulator [Paenibacillus doosanensis]|uniref:HTH-type transcriptional regulator SinR n=1 Tax=Paenibacillus konkukensis TaxID=2020716 RepID=A0ABY4RYD6_9BACL|nr:MULTISPECIES: XRE family transcriptional regulator [Paenibacillus]MCS7458617.1 XRE family transcriptional regulator [Paenibacillus doosanensis]UQZ86860.1 HTH-type transcriptional regulator SinR [Paenibacillus konkukensis]
MDISKEQDEQEVQGMVRRIGHQLRQLRKEQKLSLDDLAEKSGVSKLTLGKIERGETNPSLAVLWRIADGLSVPMFSLFAGETVVQVSRAGSGMQFTDGPWRIEPMFPQSMSGGTEIYRAYLAPRSKYSSDYHPADVMETAALMSGIARIIVSDVEHELHPHDAIRFRGGCVHTYVNDSDDTAVLLISLEREKQ